jgi:hypothetical protein
MSTPSPAARLWSLDAQVMVRPWRAFAETTADRPARPWWVAMRRPLFLVFALTTITSFLTAHVTTARLVGPPALYWTFVPVSELIAFTLIVRRRACVPMANAIDAFFAGHGPWLLGLITLSLVIASAPMETAWPLLIRVAILALPTMLIWSALIDFWFFRTVLAAGTGRAILDVVLIRAVTWPLVFGIFAVPGMDGVAFMREIAEAVVELTR